jgi:putative spermidine/putrescine transport system substrate-binding protein
MRQLVTFLFFGALCAMAAQATETLRVLTWPGYADADLVQAFEQQFDVRVEVTLVGSDEVLGQKLGAKMGGDFDVVAANTVEIKRYIDRKWLQPLTVLNIPNIARQLPRFRHAKAIPGITHLGEVYAVPYTFSEMGLIYDHKQFKAPPTSLTVLWDPAYQGRILAFDGSSHNYSIASLAFGGNPFQIDEAAYPRVTKHLIDLRRNVLTFYSLPEESVALFKQHNVAVLFANYGQQQLKQLRDSGADVGYVIPKEGALAWLDCWAVTRGARNKVLAERWVNYMLEPKVSAELTRRQGLSNTLDPSANTLETDKILWLEPVENDQRRAALWSRIMSGDRPGRF